MIMMLLGTGCTGLVQEPRSEVLEDTVGGGDRPGPSGEGATFVASESMMRRLSREELDRTIEALIFDDSRPGSQYWNEDEFSPFDNDYRRQTVSRALIESTEILAREVAQDLVNDVERRDRLMPCAPEGPGDADCLRQFIESFGRRAFRRPLDGAEVETYLTLQSFAVADAPAVDNDFYTAVALVISAMLQDPEFLYRIEVGTDGGTPGVRDLTDWEIASRLSFLLWATTPDDPLLADAEASRLSSPAGRRTAAERMWADAKARDQVRRLHRMWLGYRALPVPGDLAARFATETHALIDRVVFDESTSYLDLFSTTETYVDAELADHYGLPRPRGDEGWVDYGDSDRAGILGHGSVLAAFSKFNDTSPTQRGIMVRSRLLCLPILSPPPTVDVDQPPEGEDAACKVDRYREHMSGSCAACHMGMDPIGFGLENYDIQGRYRRADDADPNCIIDGAGELPDGLGSFSGPRELSDALIASGRLERCVAEHFLQFALGRPLDDAEGPALDALQAEFAGSNHQFRELVLGYVASDAFARVRLEDE